MSDSLGDAAGDMDTEGIADTAKGVISTLWDFFTSED